jgi:hypothetical protein
MRFMKLSLFAALLLMLSVAAVGQRTGPLDRGSSRLGVTASSGVTNQGTTYHDDVITKVNGETVYGLPFLYNEWLPGTVVTADGRSFNGYLLRYDILNQRLWFQQGEESFEVTDSVIQFNLAGLTFIHSSQLKKAKHPFYYQSLLNIGPGRLLKTNQKKIVRRDLNLPLKSDKKIFETEKEYYYFDNASKKISKLRRDGSDLSTLFKLTADEETAIGTYDLSTEQGLIDCFSYLMNARAATRSC